jgi:phospholipase/carboxylesterase
MIIYRAIMRRVRTRFILGGISSVLLVALIGTIACRDESAMTLEKALAAQWQSLNYTIVSRMPEEERGGTAILLLHGYGGSGPSFAALAEEILTPKTRVFLPTAVLPHPSGRGAMWWEFLEDDWPKPYSFELNAPSLPTSSKQLPKARAAVTQLIARIRDQFQPDRMVLVGHSQGAMLALDVAVSVEPGVDQVAAIAGYVLLDSVSKIKEARTHRPSVFISHGRQDTTIPYNSALDMKELLEKNGFDVHFRPHNAGHGVSERLMRDLRDFLESQEESPR